MSIPSGASVEETDVRRAADAIRTGGGSILVDVREPEEWAAGHAPNARHIPLRDLPDRLEALPRDAPVYLVCRSGARSHRAAAYLKQAGFEQPINVRGGMLAWERAGLPVER